MVQTYAVIISNQLSLTLFESEYMYTPRNNPSPTCVQILGRDEGNYVNSIFFFCISILPYKKGFLIYFFFFNLNYVGQDLVTIFRRRLVLNRWISLGRTVDPLRTFAICFLMYSFNSFNLTGDT